MTSAPPPQTPVVQLVAALERLAAEPTRRVLGVGAYRDACREAAGALRWLLEQLRVSELRAAQKSTIQVSVERPVTVLTPEADQARQDALRRAEAAEAEVEGLRQALVDSRAHSERLAAVSTVSLLTEHERQAATYAQHEAAQLRQKVAVLEQELASVKAEFLEFRRSVSDYTRENI